MWKNCALPALFLSVSLLSSCGGDDNTKEDIAPIDRTLIIFSPGSSELPLPNDLLFASDPTGDGTMFAGNDPTNPVIQAIDTLDGSSVLAPIDITIDGSLDPNQTLSAANFVNINGNVIPNPNQNIFLLPLTYPSNDPLLQVTGEVPSFAEAIEYQVAVATNNTAELARLAMPAARADIISLDGGTNNVIRINPLKPLRPKTKYLVVIGQVLDASGNPVFASEAYTNLRDPNTNLELFGDNAAGLIAVRAAIQGWEQLAAGYFGFMQSVFSAAGVTASAPTQDSIISSYTFTTGGTTDILQTAAAPQFFFEQTLTTSYRKDAISKLIAGTYNISGTLDASLSNTDNAIITQLNNLITVPAFGDTPNPLYNPTLAAAIASGAQYDTLSTDVSTAYLLQTIAAEAAIMIHNSGSEALGDQAPFVDIRTEAIGTVASLATAANKPVTELFAVPASQDTTFFRVDQTSDIVPSLQSPSRVYQGQITLPQLMAIPTTDISLIKTSQWQANTEVGALLDTIRGADAGTTPPSSNVTYRYPLTMVQDTVTVPILATLPDENFLANFGITKPENGWPVIIYVHGILGDRSMSLPLASALASACVAPDLSGPSGLPCYATVAIDQTVHGVEPSGSAVPGIISVTDPDQSITPNLPEGSPNTPSASLTERHYNITADASANPIPMDYSADIGASGSLFINLSNFGNARDNLRQMAFDLLNLNASIVNMDINEDGMANDIDPNNVFFAALSLGAIDGFPFIAVNNTDIAQESPFTQLPRVKGAAAFNTGGGILRLLTNSPTFSETILLGLSAATDGALFQGSSGLETYKNIFQGVLDSIDPMNFASTMRANTTSIFLTEVIGDGTSANPSDRVIPNAADSVWGEQFGPLMFVNSETGFEIQGFPAPLSGTEPLINELNAIPTTNEAIEAGSSIVTRYTEGSHGTSVSADNPEAFIDIVTTIARLFQTQID